MCCVAECLKQRTPRPAQLQQAHDLFVASDDECERNDGFGAGCAGSDFKLHMEMAAVNMEIKRADIGIEMKLVQSRI